MDAFRDDEKVDVLPDQLIRPTNPNIAHCPYAAHK
jgi:hypothetical protein